MRSLPNPFLNLIAGLHLVVIVGDYSEEGGVLPPVTEARARREVADLRKDVVRKTLILSTTQTQEHSFEEFLSKMLRIHFQKCW